MSTPTPTHTDRSTTTMPEAIAFRDAARAVAPDRPTACAGWTALDLVAHVVAGGVEIARLVSARLAGRPVPPTQSFAEREPAARSLGHDVLLSFLDGAGVVDLIGQLPLGEVVPFTGWAMDREALATHVRSELALHRWDLVGSDDLGVELLEAPELTVHAVRALESFDEIGERSAARPRPTVGERAIRLRSDDRPDVVLTIGPTGSSVALAEPTDGPAVSTDPAARLLMLWGRRPSAARHVVEYGLDDETRRVAEAWLFG
ncbi:MAG: maleylpyruvate isomerase family mycothiol-dependent enzyme [Acidimicrobiales bacterium]